MKTLTKFGIGLAALALLSPLGLWLPEYFKAQDAWGEWAPETIKNLVGYVPQGMQRFAEIWKAPLPDYSIQGWEGKSLPWSSLVYIITAVVGMAVVIIMMLVIGRWLARKDD